MSSNTEVVDWGRQYLLSNGYILKVHQPKIVQSTPWSYVVKFTTNNGLIYLKHMPALLSLEATIIKTLHNQFHAPVPHVIAVNDQLNCFLMSDAGVSLRMVLKEKFDTALLCEAIEQFSSLQLAVSDQLTPFLEMGVPDWRLDKLPSLYQQLLLKEEILIADGLTELELEELVVLTSVVSDLCKQLSDYVITETIVQPDFNENNNLIEQSTNKITIIDLGEIAISHPFFSLINILHVLKIHHGITETDDRYCKIKEACLNNYMKYETRNNVFAAFEIAKQLLPIYGALSGYRLMLACQQFSLTGQFERHGKPGAALKEFLYMSKG